MFRGEYLISLIENAAATGNHQKLNTLATRWMRRSWMEADGCPALRTLSYALKYRSVAIQSRLNGRIEKACVNEDWSNQMLELAMQQLGRPSCR